MILKTLKIQEVTPYPNNPRENSKAVGKVMASIKQYGYIQPITVDKDNVVITGHTRLEALKRLGIKEVPVIVLDLTESQAKQYRLADNKTNEDGQWNLDRLEIEMRIFEKEVLEEFFGVEIKELYAEISGKTVKPVTTIDIERAREKMGKKSKDVELITLCCPKCRQEFTTKV